MTTSSDIFAKGAEREVAGNLPLNLDAPDKAWSVAKGRIELFAAPSAIDDVAQRTHLATLGPGALMLGLKPQGAEQFRLFAIGTPGTSVREIPRDDIDSAAGEPSLVHEICSQVDAWIELLTSAVVGSERPRVTVVLQPDQETVVKPGAVVSPSRTVWLTGIESSCRFVGSTTLEVDSPDYAFPLGDSSWLEADDATSLTAVQTSQLIKTPGFWSGIERFHEAILLRASENAERAALRERHRLGLKSQAERERTADAMSRLAESIRNDPAIETATAGATDPLLAACTLVGERLSIQIVAPANYGTVQLSEPVRAIARASRARLRRVVLNGRWWEQENGPLLAFLKDGNRPVALLPAAGGYTLVDPQSGERRTVSEQVNRELTGAGFMFYRSFDPRPLTPGGVLRFSLFGTTRDWLTLVLLGLAAAVLGLFVPIATGWIIGNVVPDSDYRQLLLLISALVVNAVALAIFEFVQEIATLRIESRMSTSVEAGVLDRLLNLPASFFRQYSTGDLAMRSMGIGHIRQVLTQAAMSSMLTFVFSSVTFVLLFYYNTRLALVGTALFLIVVIATVATAFLQLPLERMQYQVRGKVAGILLQILTGISRLRVAGAENRALAYWAGYYSRQVRLTYRSQMVTNNLETFLSSVPVLSTMALFVTVVAFPTGDLTLATFLAFSAALAQVIGAAVSVGSTVSSVLDIIPLYERSKPILETLPESYTAKNDPGQLSGQIEVSHVAFRYHEGGPLVLDDVSLTIAPGEFVAFVGPSGAGKSTILRLLLGFESPEQGSIYYDDEDFAQLDRQAVRRQIGVVFQNSRLVAGDIFRNIVGSAPLTLDDAWEAAKLSGLDQDIKQMPMGMHTVISEGESTLSGGQRQRLLIARAIVNRPKMLFFDEATSALDNVTQAKVAKSLDSLKSTRVVIAHRLSTIMNADRIYVVERGKIVQQGRYEELLDAPGLFADLAKRQLI